MDFLPNLRSVYALLAAALLLGCHRWHAQPVGPTLMAPPVHDTTVIPPKINLPPGAACINPMFIPTANLNQDLVWEQIVDVVDNYFRIERENRVQLVGNVVTEGRLDTFPQVGATWLEPHLPDSDGIENRWESTYQTIRRRAVVRVIPERGGYLIDIAVYKELEDLPRPEHATAGASTFRHDSSMPSRLSEDVLRTRFSKSWLPLGRDIGIEQLMLCEIQATVTGTGGVMAPSQ
jgi:hypothetical protein